jgi:hypothetical protein
MSHRLSITNTLSLHRHSNHLWPYTTVDSCSIFWYPSPFHPFYSIMIKRKSILTFHMEIPAPPGSHLTLPPCSHRCFVSRKCVVSLPLTCFISGSFPQSACSAIPLSPYAPYCFLPEDLVHSFPSLHKLRAYSVLTLSSPTFCKAHVGKSSF